jgi:hypothetical protein
MRIFIIFLCFFASFFVFGKEIDSKEFFAVLQDAARLNGSTYGVLEGSAIHSRREKGRKITEEFPCFMAVIITPGKSITQVILNNDEGYIVGRVQKESTSVRRLSKKSGLMERIGLSPRDLAMSFLDGELLKEFEPQTLRMVPCRVFLIYNKNQQEWVKIYAAKEYFFVLKAEFFKSIPSEKSIPSRTLEVHSFAQKNSLYYVKALEIFGPGWRTDVEFDKADMNKYDPEQGTAIFRRLK